MNEKEEKLEFLKREEIRTMQKDIAKLQEVEAQKERERIATLEFEKKAKPKEEIPKKPEKVPLGTTTLIPKPLARRPAPFKKILVRGLILIFGFFIIGFVGWFFLVKKPVSPPEGPGVTPSTEETLPPEEGLEKPEIIIPPALISIQATKTAEISKIEEIPDVFNQLMKEELPLNSFTRLAIKNLAENRLASLEDLSLAFQIEIPEEIFSKLEPDFTLSIFNQKEGKRVALIGRVKEKEGLNEILKNWEIKIKGEGLSFSGEKIPFLVSSFRTTSYQGTSFRYLTISKADFGICYAWTSDGYFILTTSFESIKKVIGELQLKESEKKVGQLFMIGFEGKTVTPELEEIFKKYRPGGVLLLSKNIESKEQLKSLIEELQNLSLRETGFPLLVAVDQEGGLISRIEFLSAKTSQSEIKDIEESYQIGLERGEELKELGVNLNLAPVLDMTGPEDFLFNRTFQKNAEETAELAKALISGQKATGILTAIKHFPGYGGISFHPEEELATLETSPEVSQFKKAMEAKPEMVMTANVVYKNLDPALPFTFSRAGIQFLKNNLGSEVLIMADDLAQDYLLRNFSLKDIVLKPVEAGVDILIFSGWEIEVARGLDEFYTAFKNGEISQTKIENAVSKIIQLKQRLLR